FDSSGNCVKQLTGQLHQPKIMIDVSGLPAGIYIIRALTEENRMISDKLVVN
nr:T9SS type A sorting domain-containing protein [Bacteroidota bacterium]